MFHKLMIIFKTITNDTRYQQMGVTVSMGVNDPKPTRDSKEMADMFFEWIDINNERILERILYNIMLGALLKKETVIVSMLR